MPQVPSFEVHAGPLLPGLHGTDLFIREEMPQDPVLGFAGDQQTERADESVPSAPLPGTSGCSVHRAAVKGRRIVWTKREVSSSRYLYVCCVCPFLVQCQCEDEEEKDVEVIVIRRQWQWASFSSRVSATSSERSASARGS